MFDQPFVRLLCHADLSLMGRVALDYVHAMRTLAQVRVISLVTADLGGNDNDWSPHNDLFVRMLTGPWINVVCAPRVGPHQTWGSLVTAGVKNVLLPGDEAPDAAAAAYDVIAVPTVEAGWAWAAVVDAARLRVVGPRDTEALAALLA